MAKKTLKMHYDVWVRVSGPLNVEVAKWVDRLATRYGCTEIQARQIFAAAIRAPHGEQAILASCDWMVRGPDGTPIVTIAGKELGQSKRKRTAR